MPDCFPSKDMNTMLTCLAALAAVALLLVPPAAAHDLISIAQCYRINPKPTFLSCNQYTEPYTDLLTGLPYDTVPAYTQCVRQRCVCTGEQTDVDDNSWTTSGIQCSSAGWQESGALTCNAMVDCFKDFWECTLDALMERSTAGETLDAAELAAREEIIRHGTTPGQDFEETNMFRSCRMIMCEAAASRRNCGLLTCIPNNTQCYEYIRPPPLPDVHQLCTQGCRAVLILMALTIATFMSALMCCMCCPAPVRENQPLIIGEDEGNKEKKHRRRDSDAPDSNFDMESDHNDSNAGSRGANDEPK